MKLYDKCLKGMKFKKRARNGMIIDIKIVDLKTFREDGFVWQNIDWINIKKPNVIRHIGCRDFEHLEKCGDIF